MGFKCQLSSITGWQVSYQEPNSSECTKHHVSRWNVDLEFVTYIYLDNTMFKKVNL